MNETYFQIFDRSRNETPCFENKVITVKHDLQENGLSLSDGRQNYINQ